MRGRAAARAGRLRRLTMNVCLFLCMYVGAVVLRCHIVNIRKTGALKNYAERQAINAPIQARDLARMREGGFEGTDSLGGRGELGRRGER